MFFCTNDSYEILMQMYTKKKTPFTMNHNKTLDILLKSHTNVNVYNEFQEFFIQKGQGSYHGSVYTHKSNIKLYFSLSYTTSLTKSTFSFRAYHILYLYEVSLLMYSYKHTHTHTLLCITQTVQILLNLLNRLWKLKHRAAENMEMQQAMSFQ